MQPDAIPIQLHNDAMLEEVKSLAGKVRFGTLTLSVQGGRIVTIKREDVFKADEIIRRSDRRAS